MLLPLLLLVLAEVALESLLAPGTVDRVADGREGRNGLVLAGVAEELLKMSQYVDFLRLRSVDLH